MMSAGGGRAFLGALLALVFTALAALALWSYAVALLTDPGRVPQGWRPSLRQAPAALADSPRFTAAGLVPSMCPTCHQWRPPRARHSSAMGRCVLKMDHFCVWVVNAVGLLNYKAFLLFMTYTCAGLVS